LSSFFLYKKNFDCSLAQVFSGAGILSLSFLAGRKDACKKEPVRPPEYRTRIRTTKSLARPDAHKKGKH